VNAGLSYGVQPMPPGFRNRRKAKGLLRPRYGVQHLGGPGHRPLRSHEDQAHEGTRRKE